MRPKSRSRALITTVMALLFAACAASGETSDTSPVEASSTPETTESIDRSPSTEAPATTVGTTTTDDPEPAELSGFTGNEPAGTYRPMVFQPTFSFTISRDGWGVGYGLGKHFWLISPENEVGIDWEQPTIFFTSPDSSTTSGAETTEEVVSWLTDHPGLEEVAMSPADFSVGGVEAQTLTAVGARDSTLPLWGNGDTVKYGTLHGHRYTFHVVEVGGDPLVITLDFLDSNQQSLLGAEADEILRSIQFTGQG